ncbi:hypothetical protein G6O69_36430 [Pseudenhygromyxa sp. WMMC2535]|uniref:TlpA family protein disulfide reductase n=1 Tax=Pseudenhygromyxa sp. WMMC2535 TaxID=2712867 RepID=UPI0015564CAE|nr:hypothetical protein [Pseudenhygromyxa sp. WMMC2535]NVB43370.1 hypothetical protein [Pseudenhygromyxa sp. WMMC2535]
MHLRALSISSFSLVLFLTGCPSDDGGGEGETQDSVDGSEDDSTGNTDEDVGETTTGDETETETETDAGAETETGTDTGETDSSDTTDTGGGAACAGPVAPAGEIAVGSQVSHWAGFTVEGEDWDYCELEGTPFLLIISGAWCGPCNDLAAGFAGQGSSYDAELAPVIAGLEAGTLSAVEVLLDNFTDYGATSLEDLQAWEGMYPNEYVHLIGDPTEGQDGGEPLWIYLGPVHEGAVPSGILVDADFNLEVEGLGEAISAAGTNYGG